MLVVTGGLPAFVWGFCISTVLTWHITFSINSLTHMFGRRRYRTKDDSRNSLILALLTLGEGWHNNHHYYKASTRQGFYWWEIDVTYYVLRLLAVCGIVWDLKEPSEEIRAANRIDEPGRGGRGGRLTAAHSPPSSRQRKQPVRWSLTIPTACMKA